MPYRCAHDNCNRLAIVCYRQPVQSQPSATYCTSHSYLHGFCCHCGKYDQQLLDRLSKRGGSPTAGLCLRCYAELDF